MTGCLTLWKEEKTTWPWLKCFFGLWSTSAFPLRWLGFVVRVITVNSCFITCYDALKGCIITVYPLKTILTDFNPILSAILLHEMGEQSLLQHDPFSVFLLGPFYTNQMKSCSLQLFLGYLIDDLAAQVHSVGQHGTCRLMLTIVQDDCHLRLILGLAWTINGTLT